MKPKWTPPGPKRLKLKCDILLSTSAFKFNLRLYIKELEDGAARDLQKSIKLAGAGQGSLNATQSEP